MTTNKQISRDSELFKKGKALIEAGYEYWKEYQKEVGRCAVVWIEMENGHFILFTRGEYKQDIMARASRDYSEEPILFKPFE